MVGAPTAGLRRAIAGSTWRAIAVGAGLFVVVQVLSAFLYPAGAPQNVVGFPLPFVYTIEGIVGGTALQVSYLALAIDLLAWLAAGFGLSAVVARRTADP